MTRVTTWDSLGTETTTKDFKELLVTADLDYQVVAEDLFTEIEGTRIQVPNKKVVLREDTQEVFGIVSDRYKLCQNREAFDFIEEMEGVTLQKAGSVGGMVWMIGQLPEVEVLGDKIAPNLIFQNSHDGSCSIKTTICMLRIVCQNQFVSTFRESPATINIRHQGDLEEKLLVARQTMQEVYNYIDNYDKVANSLATQKITVKSFNKLVEGYFKIQEDTSERSKNRILSRRENFYSAYNADDNQNFKGTKWGVVNAFSDLITHEEYARKTSNWEANRFLYSLNPSIMDEFMKLVEAA